MKIFLRELYLRVTLKSPLFFKKFRALLLSVSTALTILIQSGIDFQLFGIEISQAIAILTAGAGIATFFAVNDTDELKEMLDK